LLLAIYVSLRRPHPRNALLLRRRADVDGADRLVRMDIIVYAVLWRMQSEGPHVDGKTWAYTPEQPGRHSAEGWTHHS
jgi:hypothetical protein